MKIETIRIHNFRALREIEIKNLPSYSVFVGANGSGKSTIFDIFSFLKDCLIDNVQSALRKRGGFKEVVTRGCIEEDIVIEIQFRMSIADVERLVTYHLSIGLSDENRRPIIKREILRYKRGAYGSAFHFLDFSAGAGYAITNEEDFNKKDEQLTREEQTLNSPDILAVKGLGQFQRFKAANAFRQLIENWHVSDFHITSARGDREAGYAEHLSVSGDNLPLVAKYLYEEHRSVFNSILDTMKRRVPGVSDIHAEDTVDGRLVLRFKDGAFKDPFVDRYMSDGTIKMFAYLILLYEPTPHPLLCVEEPENQLYPHLMQELAEEFEVYSSRGGQVFVSTHSPDFLNGVALENIFWLSKKKGTSAVHRAIDNELLIKLVQEGDKPGYLWKQNLFEGAELT